MAWLGSIAVTRRAYHVGRILAQATRVADRPDRKRHIRPGDLVCYVAGSTIVRQLRERGHHPMSLRTVRRALVDLEEAGLDVRRTAHTSTYVFPLPVVAEMPTEMTQKLQQIRARIALSGTPRGTLAGTPVEPRRDPQKYPTVSTTTGAGARPDARPLTTKTSEAPEAPGDASPPRPRTIPAATPRQCEFGADLGIDVDGLDLVAAGERIEIARTDRLAESRRARRKMHEHEPCPTIDGMRCYRCHERITRRGGWCPVPAPPEEHEDHENRAGYGRTPAGCPETAAHYRLVELEEAQEAEPANHPPDGLSPAESSRRSRPIHPPDGAGASLAQAAGDEHPPHAAEPEPEPDPNEPKPIDMARLRRVYEEATGRRPRKQRPRRR